MKIVYLVHQFFPEYYTGTEKFVYNISSMMQKVGHSVRVIAYSFYKDSFFDRSKGGILYKEFTYKGIPVTAIRHKCIPELVNIALGDKSMKDAAEHLLSTEKPSVVHVGHPMRVSEFIGVSKSYNIPHIITLTDFWMICPKVNLVDSAGDLCAGPKNGDACKKLCPELPRELILRRAESAREIISGAGKIVSPSKFLASLFKSEIGSLDVMVINHGMSYRKIKKNIRNYQKGDSLIFCYAGTLSDHKGVHILIDAFKRLQSNRAVLKIYGSGPNPHYVNKLFETAKEDERIQFCGVYSEDDVGNIFSNVDVVMIPSCWYEAYQLVLHEALACNIPVVASNIGVMAEKIKDGFNGLSFSVGDSEALKAVMERIIAGPEILNDLKGNIKRSLIPTVEQEAYVYHRLYTDIRQMSP